MDEEMIEAIENVKFNLNKCVEIVSAILSLIEDNHCSEVEADFILISSKKLHDQIARKQI